MTHGPYLAPSLVLNEQEILPLALFPIGPAIPRPPHPQPAFSLWPRVPLTQSDGDEEGNPRSGSILPPFFCPRERDAGTQVGALA